MEQSHLKRLMLSTPQGWRRLKEELMLTGVLSLKYHYLQIPQRYQSSSATLPRTLQGTYRFLSTSDSSCVASRETCPSRSAPFSSTVPVDSISRSPGAPPTTTSDRQISLRGTSSSLVSSVPTDNGSALHFRQLSSSLLSLSRQLPEGRRCRSPTPAPRKRRAQCFGQTP